MVLEFPWGNSQKPEDSPIRIRLDMTFDVPDEIAEQLELWGLNSFQECEYDQEKRQLKMSAVTALYRKGA